MFNHYVTHKVTSTVVMRLFEFIENFLLYAELSYTLTRQYMVREKVEEYTKIV